MASIYDGGRNLPIELIDERHRDLAIKGIDAATARDRKAAEARAHNVETVAEDARRTLRDKLGAAAVAELRAAQRAERAAFAKSLEPPKGMGVDRAKARHGYRERLDAVAKRLTIDPAAIKHGLHATNAKLDAALGVPPKVAPALNTADNFERWMALSPLHKYRLDLGVRPPLDPADPGAFQVVGPPFPSGIHRADNLASDNFRIGGDYSLSEQQGAIGNIATLDCNDAGSFDFAQSIVDTEFIFVYQAPRAGRVEVIIDAMNLFGHDDLRFEDEWGWSEHWTQQYRYFSLNAYHPAMTNRALASVSEFYKEGTDGSFSVRALTPGQHYYSHLVTDGAVAAGDTFFVGVGTRSFDRSRANDVEVHSKSNFIWLVRSVEIRVVT